MSQSIVVQENDVAGAGVGLAAPPSVRVWAVARMSNYLVLAKPRIAVMVLITVGLGFAPGTRESVFSWARVQGIVGIGLTAVASDAQPVVGAGDRRADGADGKAAAGDGSAGAEEVLVFGLLLGGVGVAYLHWQVNPLTAWLAGLTLVAYTLVYTPLKRVSSVAVILGAIPGAMPPVLGWTASGRGLDAGAFGLFAILFLWQFPHFLAIAWMYRGEYARAGLKMLPGGCDQADGSPNTPAGMLAVVYALLLVPVSLQPVLVGLAGWVYLVTALGLGLWYVRSAMIFQANPTRATARGVLLTSVMYLPVLLGVLVADHLLR